MIVPIFEKFAADVIVNCNKPNEPNLIACLLTMLVKSSRVSHLCVNFSVFVCQSRILYGSALQLCTCHRVHLSLSVCPPVNIAETDLLTFQK